jgi:hypothetical protein
MPNFLLCNCLVDIGSGKCWLLCCELDVQYPVAAVTRMGDMRNAYKILVGKPEGKNHSGDLGVDGKIILEWILRKWDGKM